MAFNKNKSIALAQKFVQKGQIDRAIKEYQKILEVDRKDIRTRLKIGDLFAKKGDNQEAARIYQEVAQSYAKDGFFLKAVAVYKNILKLCPDLIEVNLKLGDLYHQLSLLGDAMSQYQIVVNHYDRNGMVKESLDTLKKMVELDPENMTFKINLAELYFKEGHVDQAMAEFESIAQELKNSNNSEELIKVYEKIVHHDPNRMDILKDLARTYLKQHQAQRALAKLQICFKTQAKDSDTLELLAEAFLQLSQPKKAKSVYKELAQIYEDANDADNKIRVCQEALKIAPDDAEILALMGQAGGVGEEVSVGNVPEISVEANSELSLGGGEPSLSEVSGMATGGALPAGDLPAEVTQYDEEVTEFTLHNAGSPLDPLAPVEEAAQPPELSVLSSPVSVAPGAPDGVVELVPEIGEEDFEDPEEEIAKLMTETDVYLKYGLSDKAKEHLETILTKNPRHVEARYKLNELYVNLGDKAGAASQLKQLIEMAQNPKSMDPPELTQNIGKYQEELALLDPEAAAGMATRIPPVAVASVGKVEEIVPEISESDEMEMVLEDAEFPLDFDEMEIEPIAADVDISEAAMAESAIALSGGEEERLEAEIDLGIEIDIGEEELATPEPQELVSTKKAEEVSPEEVSVYDAEVPPEPRVSLSIEPTASEAQGEFPLEAREELDEAEFFVQQGLQDEARKIFDDLLMRYPDHSLVQSEVKMKLVLMGNGESQSDIQVAISTPPPPRAPSELPSGPTREALSIADEINQAVAAELGNQESFDLAAELSEELEDYQEEDLEEEGEADQQVDFNDVFDEFKKGVAKQLGKEDSETHFDLGLAYKEMHLLDDAVNEFQIAMADPKKVVDGYIMIGLCFMDKGEFETAESYFKQGLDWKSIGTQEIIGLNYEMGMAQMASGKYEAALKSFQKVKELEPGFRDVSDKIKEASGEAPSGESAPEEEMDGGFDLGATLAEEDQDETLRGIEPPPAVSFTRKMVEDPEAEVELTDLSAFDTPREKGSGREPRAQPAVEIEEPVSKPVRKVSKKQKSKSKISYV